MIDNNRTQPGSPDPNRFPRLHSFASRQIVRGYNSQHITDETSFRRPPSSFDDAIRREVLDHDIISPTLFKALDSPSTFPARKVSQHSPEHSTTSSPSPENRRGPAHDFQTLAIEASRRLQELNDVSTTVPQTALPQPAPLPPQDQPLNSWPLSRLADAAENESRRIQLARNSHTFMPNVNPLNRLKPWSGFISSSQPPPAVQNMPPQQWAPPMQTISMSLPPRVQPLVAPSTLPTPMPSHALPPPPPLPRHFSQVDPHQQQHQQYHPTAPLLPKYRQSQPQQLQQPQPHHHPQDRPPPPPPPAPAIQHHPKSPVQAQSYSPHQHYHHHHHHHHHRPPHRQLQPHHKPSPPQSATQTPTPIPVTFVHQNLSTPAPTPAPAPTASIPPALPPPNFSAAPTLAPVPPPIKTRKPRAPSKRTAQAQVDRNHHHAHQHHHHHHHNLITLQPQPKAKGTARSGAGAGLETGLTGPVSTPTLTPAPTLVPVPPPKGGQRMLLPKGF